MQYLDPISTLNLHSNGLGSTDRVLSDAGLVRIGDEIVEGHEDGSPRMVVESPNWLGLLLKRLRVWSSNATSLVLPQVVSKR